MPGYTKLFSSIVHSTIWRAEDHVRIVWITLLACSDRDGVVEASVPGLADLSRVSLEQCVAALAELSAPDPWSRTKDHEGRRIQPVEGGWRILNHGAYREKMNAEVARQQTAERVRRHRQRRCNGTSNANVTPVTQASPSPDPKADPEEEKIPRTPLRGRAAEAEQEQLFAEPKPASRKATAAALSKHRAAAARVLVALNAARSEVIAGARVLAATDENLRYIAERLAAGASEADCLHVVAVRAAEVRAGGEARWLNACTPFRAASFARAVGMRIEDARPTKTTGGVAKPGKWDDIPSGEM